MAPEIERITNTFLSNPARIEVARQATASENIEQVVMMFKGSRKDREATEKRKALRMMIDNEGDKCTNAIIFCNRKMDVDTVSKSLKKYGYDAAPIHGDLDQSQRTKTLDGFREGNLRFLVASDVAARGLDVPSVSHVFNFDVPSHAEDYVHRIGRTGRAGRDGKAMMICVPRDEKNFDAIEKLIQKQITRIDNPLKPDGAATQVSTSDAKPATEEKPKRSRTRTRNKPKDDAPKIEVQADAPVAEVKVDAPKVEAKVDTPKQQNAPREQAHRENAPRENNNRNRSNRGRGGGGNTVVGLGDHLPGFIAMSFEERSAN